MQTDNMSRRRLRKLLAGSVLLVLFSVVWMLGVSRVVVYEACNTCFRMRILTQIRVFGYPLHTDTTEQPTLAERIAKDLGIPCRHDKSESIIWRRWWGLIYCACPCNSGIMGLSIEDAWAWYDADAAKFIRTWGETEPAIRDVFQNEVLRGRNMKFLDRFVEIVKSRASERRADLLTATSHES